jgi:anaerobic nitric oxide reductase transcription regulator
LPSELAETEFFGHEKGAFTGAQTKRAGKFMLADGGTLFLDEIGELPLLIQAKLLRVLQSGEIQPVGADKTSQVNVRIIAATNRNLEQEVKEGRFRADLFHRLSVFPIEVPPLRQRQTDIPLLTGFFAEKIRKKLGIQQLKIDKNLQQQLIHYDWPGNIRELEHVISRSALKAKQHKMHEKIINITSQYCDLVSSPTKLINKNTVNMEQVENISLKVAVDDFQRKQIKAMLIKHNYNWAAAARALSLDRANLVRLAKRLDIKVTKSL